jgi:hypothetical protein
VLHEAGDTMNTVCFPKSAVISRCHACKREMTEAKWWVGMAPLLVSSARNEPCNRSVGGDALICDSARTAQQLI